MASQEQPKNKTKSDPNAPINLGEPFTFPDGQAFTIFLPFKDYGPLTPFSGRWDASREAVRDFPSMALEHLAITHRQSHASFNMVSRSSRRAYLSLINASFAAKAAAAAAVGSRSAGEVGEGMEGGEEEEGEGGQQQQHQQQQQQGLGDEEETQDQDDEESMDGDAEEEVDDDEEDDQNQHNGHVVEGEELGDEDEDEDEEAAQVGDGSAPASASNTPGRVRLRGNDTTIDDIRPLLVGTYVLFLQEFSGWYAMVDLETNRIVNDLRAIPRHFVLKWGTPRGSGRIGAYTHVKKYVLQIQVLEQLEYRCMGHIADFILQRTGMDKETFVEVKGMRRECAGWRDVGRVLPEEMHAFLEGRSGEEDEEERVRRGRAAYKRMMPLVDRIFPLAEGEPEVIDCGPTYGDVPVVDEELERCISILKEEKFHYSVEEMMGWIAEKKTEIRDFSELNKIGTKDCIYRVWG